MTTVLDRTCIDALRTVVAADTDLPAAVASAELRAARRHLEACPRCAGVLDDEPTAAQALAAAQRRRPVRPPGVRALLCTASAVQLAVALPWLLGWNPFGAFAGHVTPAHLTRDGAIGVIVGVAGIGSALRPRHAVAMLFTAIAAVAMQAFGFAVDESANRVSVVYETLHLFVPMIIAGIGTLAMRKDTPIAPPVRGARLRVVRSSSDA